MSEPPPTGVAQGPAVADQQALTPAAVEAVLADFRAWLAELASPPPAGETPGQAPPPAEAVDLHTLLGQFIALRHEVNLQTKASRAQLEQNAEALRQLAQAHDSLCKAQAVAQEAQEQGQEELLRPLLKTLVDLYDALSLGGREAQRVRDAVLPVLDQTLAETEPEGEPPPASPALAASASRPFWAFWRQQPSANDAAEVHARWEAWWKRDVQRRQARTDQVRQSGERLRQMLNSLITGYTMSLQRVERALRQHGLEPLPAEGEAFDPETMEVVEAVTDSGHAPGTVLEEVRRGYLWNGRVFRYAQVRVAKS
jgi:molecular chaperone GrpE